MMTLKQTNATISTVLAFALIPLSGFATDVYIPSFPAMAEFFGTAQADIQLSLVFFVVSSGLGQLFVGSLLDSFGRYRPSLIALLVFAIASFIIAISANLSVLLTLRVVQGLAVATIVVSKRAFFIDLFSGSQLKNYTSLFSIMWATAPIIAPFLGGFLQHYFGWQSNFYFLGIVTIVLLILELAYSGETLRTFQPLKLRGLLNVYSSILRTPDYTLSIVNLGLCFANVLLFNMAGPFIIEHGFHQSAVTTGNSSLLSGLAVLTGGLLSKTFINRSIGDKLSITGPLFFLLAGITVLLMDFFPSLTGMIIMVMLLHLVSGFMFNTFYTYALGRFSTNVGLASGLTGGGTYILTSVFSYSVVRLLHVQSVVMLGVAYLLLASLTAILLVLFMQSYNRRIIQQPAIAKP